MARNLFRILGIIAALVVAFSAWAYWRVGGIEVEKIADRLYMMKGLGGNVGVLVTDAGVVVVDTMTFVRQGTAIRARIAAITDRPIVAVINTHYHADHTHGNPAFEPGTKVVATERTLRHLKERDGDFWRGSPAADFLPNETFADEREYRYGEDVVRVVHPGRGHTDGDLVVLFVGQRVLHAGDLFFNGRYPNIDLEAGGTVEGWIETLEGVKRLEADGVIPGHGRFSDRAGLERFQEFLRTLWDRTSRLVREGATLEQAQKRVDLSRFEMTTMWYTPRLTHDFVVARAYEEASRKR